MPEVQFDGFNTALYCSRIGQLLLSNHTAEGNRVEYRFESIYHLAFLAWIVVSMLVLKVRQHILMDLILLQSKQPFTVLALLLSFCTATFGAGPNFTACLQSVVNSGSLEGTVDTNGNPTTNISLITGLTYGRCLADCGSGPVDFNWHTFSQQFTSWLLPWLALISQLPYGTRDALSNFVAVILTVGSPTLAAYSLSLAVISNRWMVKRFGRSTHANTRVVANVLSNLQQVSLVPSEVDYALPSPIFLPENRRWWKKLDHGLNYPVQKWTLASIMSVLYVALADTFTWVDTLSGPLSNVVVNATGESISSLWLCFLPIVIGNLQISPKSDCDRIRKAFDEANKSLYVSTNDGSPEQAHDWLLINIRKASEDVIDEDELCSAPVFFYARAFTWIRVARQVADSFDAASRERGRNTDHVPPTASQQQLNETKPHRYEVYTIFLRSVFLAIFLQWGTTGAAIMAMFFTPTKGQFNRSSLYPTIFTHYF